MNNFKIGDRVRLVRPANQEMLAYLGKVSTVVSIKGKDLRLAYPFWCRCYYSPEQFDLVN